MKDLKYWRENAEEDYMKVPISVLRYISELEKNKTELQDRLNACHTVMDETSGNLLEWFPDDTKDSDMYLNLIGELAENEELLIKLEKQEL